MHTPALALGVGDQSKPCSVRSLSGAAPSRTDESVAHTPATIAASHRCTMAVLWVLEKGVDALRPL